MTAYTSLYRLPFQEASDRPCDAPDVWCELAGIVDDLFEGMDDILNRIEPAVPAARVYRSMPQLIAANVALAVATFDSVAFDTDNMVDLARRDSYITPSRTGSYYVLGHGHIVGPAAAAPVAAEVAVGFVGFTTTTVLQGSGPPDTVRGLGAGTNAHLRVEAVLPFDAENGDGFGFSLIIRATTAAATLTNLDLAAYWICDEEMTPL